MLLSGVISFKIQYYLVVSIRDTRIVIQLVVDPISTTNPRVKR